MPRTRVSKVKNSWRISDGTSLVAELFTAAVPIAEDDDGWETLLLARNRTEVTLADLVAWIREGRLAVGRRPDAPGFHGVVVRMADVDQVSLARRAAERTTEAELPGVMSAAEFGRSVGLRDQGHFVALIETGHTPAMHCTHPRTGRCQYRLSAEYISSFHRRYVTVPTLSAQTGYHRNTIRSLLAASRVPRFADGGRDFGPVYLRAEALKALR